MAKKKKSTNKPIFLFKINKNFWRYLFCYLENLFDFFLKRIKVCFSIPKSPWNTLRGILWGKITLRSVVVGYSSDSLLDCFTSEQLLLMFTSVFIATFWPLRSLSLNDSLSFLNWQRQRLTVLYNTAQTHHRWLSPFETFLPRWNGI